MASAEFLNDRSGLTMPWDNSTLPQIGIGEADPAMDVVVASEAEAEALAANIKRFPHAASILVQLLRQLPSLDDKGALLAESLAYGVLQGSDEHIRWRATRKPLGAVQSGSVITVREGGTLSITLDRPHALNAIDVPMRDALREAFELAALDPEIQSVTLAGNGRAFSMGAELSEFGTTLDPAAAHAIRMATLPAHAMVCCSHKLTAHIHGACVGSGLEMAAFAHRITASRKAWFQLPELAMGLIPGAGGCVSVSRRIGRQRAALMILSGKRVSAETALGWGLIDAIVDD